MRAVNSVLIVLLACPWPVAAAGMDLTPYSARYEVRRSGFKAERTVQLRRGDGSGEYLYESRNKAKGALSVLVSREAVETGRFLVTDSGLKPLRYQFEDGTKGSEDDIDIVFDWSANTATVDYENETTELAVEPGTLDPITVQLVIGSDIEAGVSDPKHSVVEKNRLRTFIYRKLGAETITTKAGEFETLQYEVTKEGSRRSTVSWVAPALQYLPVRIHRLKDGKADTTMELVEFDGF